MLVFALYQFWDRILNSAGICVGFGSDGGTEASVRRCWKFPSCLAESVLDRSEDGHAARGWAS